MACKSCLERRKKLQALRDAKKLKRQSAQAAAIGAVLAVTEAAGKVLGINGEEDNEQLGRENQESGEGAGGSTE
jgi:hypothetical protein